MPTPPSSRRTPGHTPCRLGALSSPRPSLRAQRSNPSCRAKNGLLRCARNDVPLVSDTTSSSRREAPEVLHLVSAPKEGVGNAGRTMHPRSRVHFVLVERTRVTTSTPKSPGIPARNGFNGFLRALLGDRALLPPSPCGLKVLSSPVEPNEPPQDLTPASRRQDHTTSPSAS